MKQINKRCSCGNLVPFDKDAPQNELGHWIDCECKSTLLFPITKNKDNNKRLEQERKEANERVKRLYNLNKKIREG